MSKFHQNPSYNFSTLPKELVVKNKSSKKSGKSKSKGANTSNHNNNTSINKNEPLKVVYISNPMRYQTTADEFRDLVQGLTGRDAAEWPDYYNDSSRATGVQAVGAIGSVQNDEVVQEVVQQETLDEHSMGCFGQSDLMSYGYYGAFEGDNYQGDRQMAIMEDLQALMAADHIN